MFPMDLNPINPANSLRRNHLHNIGSDRLVLRAHHIDLGHSSGGRMGFAMRAAELEAIHVELVRRHGPAMLQLVPDRGPLQAARVLEIVAA